MILSLSDFLPPSLPIRLRISLSRGFLSRLNSPHNPDERISSTHTSQESHFNAQYFHLSLNLCENPEVFASIFECF